MNSSPVILQNIRVRGLGDVIESNWVEIGKKTSFFSLPGGFNRKGFLHALQTVNPPYVCRKQKPFVHYPLITRQGKYTKRVRPHRRTISFAIFVGTPQIVEELAVYTPHLYETDRIEVGRRLDYSRWVNFVELAGSTRWSEVEDSIQALVKTHGATLDPQLRASLNTLDGSDRIVNRLLEDLAGWLRFLVEKKREEKEKIDQLLFFVERQHHFSRAKKFIRQRLPVFHVVNRRKVANRSEWTEKKKPFPAVCGYIDWLLRKEKIHGAAPVLLFDEPDLAKTQEIRRQLREHVAEISRKYQCLYLAAEEHEGEPPAGARCITAADLLAD
ncbi:MAG TPA: hypothetical protein VJ969_05290 [Desulfopila sp.]|nr:hypothetical protein [Desulfopila sp.]